MLGFPAGSVVASQGFYATVCMQQEEAPAATLPEQQLSVMQRPFQSCLSALELCLSRPG